MRGVGVGRGLDFGAASGAAGVPRMPRLRSGNWRGGRGCDESAGMTGGRPLVDTKAPLLRKFLAVSWGYSLRRAEIAKQTKPAIRPAPPNGVSAPNPRGAPRARA